MGCVKCGKCCTAIRLNKEYTEDVIRSLAISGNEDAKFIHENWVPISAKEAFALRPEEEFRHIFQQMGECSWWRCTRLDEKTHTCTVYNKRPGTCISFPGNVGKDFVPYTYGCGYLEGQEVDCKLEYEKKKREEI